MHRARQQSYIDYPEVDPAASRDHRIPRDSAHDLLGSALKLTQLSVREGNGHYRDRTDNTWVRRDVLSDEPSIRSRWADDAVEEPDAAIRRSEPTA